MKTDGNEESSYNPKFEPVVVRVSDFKGAVADLARYTEKTTPRSIVERLNGVSFEHCDKEEFNEDTPILIETEEGLFLITSLTSTEVVFESKDGSERTQRVECIIVGTNRRHQIAGSGDDSVSRIMEQFAHGLPPTVTGNDNPEETER